MPDFKVRKFVDRVGLIRTRQADGRLRYDHPSGIVDYSMWPLWTDDDLRQFEERDDLKEINQ